MGSKRAKEYGSIRECRKVIEYSQRIQSSRASVYAKGRRSIRTTEGLCSSDMAENLNGQCSPHISKNLKSGSLQCQGVYMNMGVLKDYEVRKGQENRSVREFRRARKSRRPRQLRRTRKSRVRFIIDQVCQGCLQTRFDQTCLKTRRRPKWTMSGPWSLKGSEVQKNQIRGIGQGVQSNRASVCRKSRKPIVTREGATARLFIRAMQFGQARDCKRPGVYRRIRGRRWTSKSMRAREFRKTRESKKPGISEGPWILAVPGRS